MDEVSRWLARHGLQQYTEPFIREGISHDLLTELKDADLAELGLNIGDRLRFRRAIEKNETVRQSPPTQRRLLTVLFVDLVGSTALSEQLDPEHYRQLIISFQQMVERKVEALQGTVTRYAGDAIVAYFGWPQAMEHSAERAVRAALSSLAHMHEIESSALQPLRARAGIASGPVVVEAQSSNGTLENIAMGTSPNLAARLQSLAKPSTLLICEQTKALCDGQFEMHSLGPQLFKGFSRAQQCWRVEREVDAASRFEAATRHKTRRLIGRAGPIERLNSLWEDALRGTTKCVLLCGEAGMGKSSLAHHFHQTVTSQHWPVITLQCSLEFSDDAYNPLQGLLNKHRQSIPKEVSQHLQQLLTPLRQGSALNLDHAKQKKQRGLRSLTRYLKRIFSTQASLILIEDVHWIDQSSLELLQQIRHKLQEQRLLLLLTSRSQAIDTHADDIAIDETIHLRPLEDSVSSAVVRAIAGSHCLDESLVEKIVERAEGVPLFLEEFTLAVVKNSLDPTSTQQTELSIPNTLQESLMARLDRHPAMRAVAQHGSVLGRTFNLAVFKAIIGRIPEADRQQGLQALLEDGLIQINSETGSGQFKHALLRDLAYQSLIREDKRQLHHWVSKTIREEFPEMAKRQPARMAQHLAAASESAHAIRQWLLAVDQARARFAHAEASSLLNSAEQELLKMQASQERNILAFETTFRRGHLCAYYRWSADDTGAAFRQALKLAQTLGSEQKTFDAELGLWSFYRSTPDFTTALQLSEKLLEKARKIGTPYSIARAKFTQMISLFYLGKLREFNSLFHQFKRHIGNLSTTELTYDRMDIKVSAPAQLNFGAALCGNTYSTHPSMQQIIQQHGDCSSPQTRIWLYFISAAFYTMLGDVERVDEYSQIALALALKHNDTDWQGLSQIHRTWVALERNNVQEARAALDHLDVSKTKVMRPYYQSIGARLLLAEDKPIAATKLIDESLELCEKTGENWWVAGLLILRGDCQLEKRTESYQAALHVAQQQGNALLSIQASTKLLEHSSSYQASMDHASTLEKLLDTVEADQYCRCYHQAKLVLSKHQIASPPKQ